MIAVNIDDDGTVKVADINENWYNYEAKSWANAVLIKDNRLTNYANAKSLSIINTDDILGYFVWIPRYKYRIKNSKKGIPSTIDLIFEDKNTSKSKGDAISNYYTHPAFTFGMRN